MDQGCWGYLYLIIRAGRNRHGEPGDRYVARPGKNEIEESFRLRGFAIAKLGLKFPLSHGIDRGLS